MDAYYREYRASIHRGVYPLAARPRRPTRARATRSPRSPAPRRARRSSPATRPRRSTSSPTPGAAPTSRPGDLLVVTEMEHHSNLVPWQMLCQRTGAELAYVPIDDEGLLLEELDALLARGPKLVAVAHVSNVLGTVNPIAEIVARAHAAGAVVIVDGAQAAPHLPLDVHALGADFYAWTAHKAYGPTGHRRAARPPRAARGDAAVPRRRAHDRARREVRRAATPSRRRSSRPARRRSPRPSGWRRGRLPLPARHGGRVGARARPRRLRAGAAGAIDGLEIHGPADLARRGSVVSFALDGIHPHDVAEILGREGVCVRAGHTARRC